MREVVTILGVPIDNLSVASALDKIEAFVQIGRIKKQGHQIATVNTNFLTNALFDPSLNDLLTNVDMATADGMPLIWASRILGSPLKERVTGSDMVPSLAARAAERGMSLYLLGAAPGVAQRAAQKLQEKHPDLVIAGFASPPFGPIEEMDPAVIEDIKRTAPDILLVAFGNPKQEKWIAMYGPIVNVPVMIGVGATLDFIAGKTKRAPQKVQRLGLEWAYRIAQEPRRLWRRYAINLLVFFPCIFWQWAVMQWQNRRSHYPPVTSMTLVNNTVILSVQGSLHAQNYRAFFEEATIALQQTPFLLLNLSGAESIDYAAVGALMELTKQARQAGGDLKLLSVPKSIERTLACFKGSGFFDTIGGESAESTPIRPSIRQIVNQVAGK
jgi:N-acetylglucosaminyldiphosphoundecaprenol N-acetyl-beta-D-mannosaminyltransferase